MADNQMGPIDTGFVDKRRGRSHEGVTLSEQANYSSITSLKTRLTALAPTVYTTAKMNTMSVNDLVFALRNASGDSAGIK